MITSRRFRQGAAVAVATAALSFAPLAASASAVAEPAGAADMRCSLQWHDDVSVGVKCTGGGAFGAVAICKNGKRVYGALAGADTVSYAHCSSVHSSLRHPISESWGYYTT